MQAMRRHLVLLIVPVLFLLDRYTKLVITDGLEYHTVIPVTGFLSIVHARNYGGAFSFLADFGGARYVFTLFPLIVIVALAFVLARYNLAPWKRTGLTLILAGAVGNIYDRILYGYVVDFLDFHYGNLHWPAFNVADMAITTGAGLWLFAEFRESFRKKCAPQGP